jgi:hypothetical protein
MNFKKTKSEPPFVAAGAAASSLFFPVTGVD